MKMGIYLLVCALFGLACSDGDGDPGGTTSESNANRSDATGCAAFCARSVGCANDPAANCVASCQQSARLCPAQSAAALACAQDQPNSAFHCDAELRVTALNEDVCASQTDTLVECVIDAVL